MQMLLLVAMVTTTVARHKTDVIIQLNLLNSHPHV